MNKLTIFDCVVFVVILAALAWMSNEDYKQRLIEEQRTAEIMEDARKVAAQKKSEYNKLAFEAERMTGIKGDMK
jgi:preprotein translocase subunit SecG